MSASHTYGESDSYITLLSHIASIASGTADESTSLFSRILDEIVYSMDCEAAWIQLIDPDAGRCVTAAHRGFSARMVNELNALAEDSDWVKKVVQNDKRVIFGGVSAEESNFIAKMRFPGVYRSYIAVLFQARGKTSGILGILSKTPDRFNRHDVIILSIAGAFISAVAESAASKVGDQSRQHSQLISLLGEREEFLNALSHELQTPLTALIASAGMLSEELAKDPKSSITRLIRNIIQSSSTLKERVNELLDLSREHAAGYDIAPSPIDATAVLHRAADEVAPLAKSKKQTLSIDIPSDPIIINGDTRRLEQIALNLLSNAIKFTPPGGSISLRVRDDIKNLVVSVEDTGGGIPKEEQSKLFRPYYRLPADRHRVPGLGLGLSITRQLIELHGGKIWVESHNDKGTTFFFSIPLKT